MQTSQLTSLTSRVLMRLAGHALLTYVSGAEGLEARMAPGAVLALTGEPVADLNYILIANDAPNVDSVFESYVDLCTERELPFVAMLGPDVGSGVRAVCERAGLVHAVAWPLMVCPASAAEEHAVPGVDVRRVETAADVEDMASILAEAFQMPLDAVRRTLPLSMTQLPGVEVYVARRDGRALSTVTATRHDRIVGIWSMGTLPDAQGQGVGKALLAQVMTDHQRRGAEAFFLGATPAGLPLYQRLGYETIAEAQVWVRGETSQA